MIRTTAARRGTALNKRGNSRTRDGALHLIRLRVAWLPLSAHNQIHVDRNVCDAHTMKAVYECTVHTITSAGRTPYKTRRKRHVFRPNPTQSGLIGPNQTMIIFRGEMDGGQDGRAEKTPARPPNGWLQPPKSNRIKPNKG